MVVLLFLFTSSIIQAETEPNDTKFTATPILLNNTQAGSVSSSDKQDWWKIVITEAGEVFIRDSVLSATGNSLSLYSIYLYDNDGETLVTS
ncbi:MAG TPA: hypothetical protein VJ909_03905, partial [Prolixibacteraceae bacterium]|nr:hypothetical protein [Prolixibacteraceae bacterium]